MKEEDYVMKLMATCGALRPIDEEATQRSVTRRNGIRENVSFKDTEPFFNHFKFCNQMDDHNNNRYSPISLEQRGKYVLGDGSSSARTTYTAL
jgi:hypothetical protein